MTQTSTDQLDTRNKTVLPAPDIELDVRETFGIDIDMKVPAFSVADERTPDVDDTYVFDPDTTLAILAGFAFNGHAMEIAVKLQIIHQQASSTHFSKSLRGVYYRSM